MPLGLPRRHSPSKGGATMIDAASKLSFLPLSVTPDGEEFLVGHAESGTFVAMPAIGVWLLRELQSGLTLQEAAAKGAEMGLELDVVDFAAALIEAGLADLDQVKVPLPVDGLALTTGAAWARPLFTPLAWTLYALALLGSILLLLLRPAYIPVASDLFFHPNTGISLAVMGGLSWVLVGIHELCHGLAGRLAGAPVRFRLGRRLWIPVLETDLTGLWALPRRKRYGPFLAGMAWDSLVLAVALSLRLLSDQGYLRLVWPGLPAAIALHAMSGLLWQSLVFLRTDLYAVMVNLLGCRNLYRTTYLHLKGRLWRLLAREATELEQASERDRAVARWFGWLYLAGLLWATYFLLFYALPALARTLLWVWASLRGPIGLAFWLALPVGAMALLQLLWPLWLYLRRR